MTNWKQEKEGRTQQKNKSDKNEARKPNRFTLSTVNCQPLGDIFLKNLF